MLDSQQSDPNTNADELAETRWNLNHILENDGTDPAAVVDALLDEAESLAESFSNDYSGKVDSLDTPGLTKAMRELERLYELITRPGVYAALSFSTDTADPQRGALMQHVEERATAIQTRVLFFELEWAAIDEKKAEGLLASPELDFCRHHLRRSLRYRPHLLSEPEEKIFSEKSLTGRNAWTRLFEEQTASISLELEAGEPSVALEVALSQLHSPEQSTRRDAAEKVTKALEPGLRTRGFIMNTLLADKMVEDRLRKYPHWLASRNLSNEASDESVEALVKAVKDRYDLPRRWYKLKAEILGIDRLADYDRMAPISDVDERFSWSAARELVADSYQEFSPELGGIVGRFLNEGWIDAPTSEGKRGGAFCAPTIPRLHPYVLLNYTSRRRDVMTLAHELGHGVHFALSAQQGIFHMETPLTLAETASTFGERLVFHRLLEQAERPESRLALQAESIDDSIATIFRQISMLEFERAIHTDRRERGEIPTARINELWAQTQTELFGDSVEVTDDYHSWWSYIPHFISTPGYVYAYAYGQLVALAIYAQYEEQGESFVPNYLEFLGSGGSKKPEDLVKIIGIDLADPDCWGAGLALLDKQLDDAETAARTSGRIR